MARQVAVITGASGGIGAELARVMAKAGHDLALVARSEAPMQALADEITADGRPRPLVLALDLGVAGAASKLQAALGEAQAEVQILVNNAGFGLLGEVAKLDQAEQLAIIDLNVRALTEMTLTFLPQITRLKGRILNVASIAAFMPGPGMAVYYASKAYVLSFSQSLGEELRGSGVSVSALCPGPVLTGFQARAKQANSRLLDVYKPVPSLSVAQQGYDGLMRGSRVIVPGWMNKLTVWSVAFTPKSLLLRVTGRLQATRRTSV